MVLKYVAGLLLLVGVGISDAGAEQIVSGMASTLIRQPGPGFNPPYQHRYVGSDTSGVQLEASTFVGPVNEIWSATTAAIAKPGAVGASASLTAQQRYTLLVSSIAAFGSGDLIFTGSGPEVTTSLNLLLDGSLTRTHEGLPYGGSLRVTVRVNDGALDYYHESGSLALTIEPEIQATGLLTGFPGPGDAFPLTTSPFTVPTGVPLWFSIEIESEVFIGYPFSINEPSPVSVTSDFLHTLTLPDEGQVFNNPDNDALFDVDSIGMSVAGNGFTPVPVPEPAALSLLLLAAPALLSRGRAKRN